ncbi:MAG: B12-binding domain-containing radical SAM protein [Chloroflexi bacterium]|nr:B12-binding domain-containing radical SAM protein [Chloroflexota bacterium]
MQGQPSPLHGPGAILLVSCYELGHQPLSLASPLAYLARAGYGAAAVDTAVGTLSDRAIRRAQLVGISVPMHTALRLGVQVAERIRTVNPTAHICFYGHYALLNAEYLLRHHADSVVGGEFERPLLDLVQALDRGQTGPVAGVRTRRHPAGPTLEKLPFAVPARDALPALAQYAQLQRDGARVPAGYVEATRGCLHTCLHCPITPVYRGRFFVVPPAVVLADIRHQVAAGARHITFGDPDFLNGPGHVLKIVRAMHEELPDVTFDATIKIEHVLEHRRLFPELRRLGCIFVVSAVESLSDTVLGRLKKGHTRAGVVAALAILDAAGIPLRPSLVSFTPWTTIGDYADVLEFVEEHDLIEHVDPVHYAIRLLVPPGSALLDEPDAAHWFGELDEASYTHRWAHPDPRMDRLHQEVSALVESAERGGQDVRTTFARIRALVGDLFGARLRPPRTIRPRRPPPPRLTESWFC